MDAVGNTDKAAQLKKELETEKGKGKGGSDE
jgi:hypothetical protein